MDMPTRYGSYKTAWKKLKRWQDEDVWDRIFKVLVSMRCYDRVSVDSSTVETKKGGL
jgi:transposase